MLGEISQVVLGWLENGVPPKVCLPTPKPSAAWGGSNVSPECNPAPEVSALMNVGQCAYQIHLAHKCFIGFYQSGCLWQKIVSCVAQEELRVQC